VEIEISLVRFFGEALPLCAYTVSETFTDPVEVTYWSMADCGLTTVPGKIGSTFLSFFLFFFEHSVSLSSAASFVNVTELDLSWNKLSVLPDWMQRINVTALHLNGNKLSSLPDWMQRIKNLWGPPRLRRRSFRDPGSGVELHSRPRCPAVLCWLFSSLFFFILFSPQPFLSLSFLEKIGLTTLN